MPERFAEMMGGSPEAHRLARKLLALYGDASPLRQRSMHVIIRTLLLALAIFEVGG